MNAIVRMMATVLSPVARMILTNEKMNAGSNMAMHDSCGRGTMRSSAEPRPDGLGYERV